jgi:hypothetical protein
LQTTQKETKMKNQLYKAALLAALGLASATAAQAQVGPALGAGQVGLGFNDLAGPGSANNDYVINLGSFTLFTTTSIVNASINPTTFNTAFNTDPSALNNVAVGAVEGVGSVGGNIMLTAGTMPTVTTFAPIATGISDIAAVNTGEYSSSAGTPTAPFSKQVATSPISSVAGSVGALVANPLSYLSGGTASLTLWEATISGTSRTPIVSSWSELGTISVNANAGVDTISFTGVNATPEPTTYSLLGGAGLLFFGLRRPFRKKNA